MFWFTSSSPGDTSIAVGTTMNAAPMPVDYWQPNVWYHLCTSVTVQTPTQLKVRYFVDGRMYNSSVTDGQLQGSDAVETENTSGLAGSGTTMALARDFVRRGIISDRKAFLSGGPRGILTAGAALAGSAIAEYICELTIIMVVAFCIICIICITTTEPPKDTLKFPWLSRCHQRRNAENDQNAVEMVHRSC